MAASHDFVQVADRDLHGRQTFHGSVADIEQELVVIAQYNPEAGNSLLGSDGGHSHSQRCELHLN